MTRTNSLAKKNGELLPTDVTEEQVKTLFNSIPLAIGVSVALAAILTYAESEAISKGDLMIWNMLMISMLFSRTALWFYWQNATSNIPSERWLSYFRIGVLFAGLVWGSSSYFMFATFNPTHQALLAFTLAGVASGSMTTLSVDKLSAISFVVLSVFPLSIRLYLEHGPIALPMCLMTLFFIFFVLSASIRASRELKERFDINRQLIQWGNEREETQIISNIINNAQRLFIANNQDKQVFAQLLTDTLDFSGSKFGFIGEVLLNKENEPILKMRELTNISWDKSSLERYEKHLQDGMEFSGKGNFIASVLYNQKPIISNSPAQDMRAGGTPEGHPPLTSFLGIPIFNGAQLIGILGLANNPAGYSEADIEAYKPITQLISQIFLARRHQQQHLEDEQKIIKHLRHTQAILDDAFEAIITTDKRGNILSFNHAAETIFGYSADYIKGRNVSLLMPSPFRDQHDSHLGRYMNTGAKHIIGLGRELVGVRKNGKEFPLEIAISEVNDGEDITFIGMIKDISERHHVDKLKNDFIASVSHDLRTPLTSISASLSLLDSETFGKLPEKVKKLISIAKQNSIRLEGLIVDLLDMDKLINNQLDLDIQTFDLLNVIETSLIHSQYLAEKYQVNVKITHLDGNSMVRGDQVRTQQILDKLLANAAKFSPSHSFVEVTLAKTQHSVKVSVIDYGKGILPEHLESIFHRFTRSDLSNPNNQDNRGLGLSLCKELIEKMGGKMGVTSQINQGSCFFFELPAAT